MNRKVAIVTTKQPGTNPRVRKSADALSAAGFDVHVFYAYTASWADAADEITFGRAQWQHKRVGGHPVVEKAVYFKARFRSKLAGWLGMSEMELCPSLPDYNRSLKNLQPDIVIGHNPGSLPILHKWHSSTRGKVVFDAEDYHRGESYWVRVGREQTVIQLEDKCLGALQAMTAASPLIAKAYEQLYPHLIVVTVNNAFSRDLLQPFPEPETGPLRVVWFSQVLGLDRGLGEFLKGLSQVPDVPISITLVGMSGPNKRDDIASRIQSPLHQVEFVEPLPEKELLAALGRHEIGLALEVGSPVNRDICRTNKLYTYPLAGCYMLASKTSAQRDFLREWPDTGCAIDLGEPSSIAQALSWAYEKRDELLEKRRSSWEQANTTLNWETESKPLVQLVQRLTS